MASSSFTMALLAATAALAPLSWAMAQAPAPDTSSGPVATASTRTTAEEIIVYGVRKGSGGGLIKPQTDPKSISTVSSAFIKTQAAVENAFQYVQLTPGALVSTTDPYGLNEQYSLNLHGLGQDELGYVLEGMPLNDIGFYSAFPSQFIDSENIDEISLQQGTAELDSPVISATGGLMSITMLDPSLRPGGSIDVSYGSYDAERVFVRLDSGLIGNTGFRTFLSYSRTEADNWHGPGRGRRQHVDYKVAKEWGDNRITLTGTYSDAITPLYVQPTKSSFQSEGVNGPDNNYAGVYNPNDAAGGTDFYGLHIGTFRILYMSAPARLHLADNLVLNVTPYWQYGYGNSPYGAVLTQGGNPYGDQNYTTGGSPYNLLKSQTAINNNTYNLTIPNPSIFNPNGNPVMANYTDLQYRAGLVSKLTYTSGPNSLLGGVWLDYSDETDTQSYSQVSTTGFPADIWADQTGQLLRLPDGQPYLAGEDRVITKIVEPFIGDILHMMNDKLTFEVGFKLAFVDRSGTNGVPGPQYRVTINNTEPLPRAAVRYQIDARNQIFANISTNFRTPSEATFFNSYDGTSIYFQANNQQKAEYSTSEDFGYRYSGPLVTASATVFNFFFTNRQVATSIDDGTIQESINAGDQSTTGLDLEAGTRPWRHISPYVSGEYLHSVDDSDFPIDGVELPTAGKTSVRSPKFQAAIGLNYDYGPFFSNFNVKFVDSQYATFLNDEKIPAYITANLSLGARLPSYGLKTGPELKLNIINLTGANYLASAANPTPNAQAVTVNGVAVPGSSPTYYLSGGLAVMFTATQAF